MTNKLGPGSTLTNIEPDRRLIGYLATKNQMRYMALIVTLVTLLGGCSPSSTARQSADQTKAKSSADNDNTKVSKATAGLKKLKPGRHELTIAFDGGDLNYAVRIPEDYDSNRAAPLVIGLHYSFEGDVPPRRIANYFNLEVVAPGLGDLAEKAIIVSPVSLGGKWTTRENEEAVVYLTKQVMESFNTDRNQVILAGFDIGGSGVWHIGGLHQDLFKFGIAVASAPVGADRWTNPILIVQSNDDSVVPAQQVHDAVATLESNGVSVDQVWIDAGPYDVPKFVTAMREAIPTWWEKQLAKE